MRLYGLLQIPLGIIAYFNTEERIRVFFLGGCLVLGMLIVIASFSKGLAEVKPIDREKRKSAQKCNRILGASLSGIALLAILFFDPGIGHNLILLDAGLLFLMMSIAAPDGKRDFE